MISINSVEELRKELDIVNKDITETQAKINRLMKYRNDITDRINRLQGETKKILTLDIFTGEDPILEAMNTLKDTDEIKVEDVAYMIGITKPTLMKIIDPSKVREVNLTDRRSTLLLNVGYIKELLSTHDEGDKDKRKYVEDLLSHYYWEGIPISIGRQMRFMESVPYIKPEYEKLNLRQLIIGGYNRGFVKSRIFTTMMRMLESYNSLYFIDPRTRTVDKRFKKRQPIVVYCR